MLIKTTFNKSINMGEVVNKSVKIMFSRKKSGGNTDDDDDDDDDETESMTST